MSNQIQKTYYGIIKMFNGQYGFIKSEQGETFFHKSDIAKDTILNSGDTVEFQVKPSMVKKGKLQAYDIIISIKNDDNNKSQQKLIDENKSKPKIIGILKWFDDDKGFGIICTPENQDYVLRRSNLLNNQIILEKHSVLVFSKKLENNENIAIFCRLAENYEDWEIAMDYLNKSDKVTIINTFNRGRSYTTNTQLLNLKYRAAYQILKTKEKEQRIEYISNYFKTKVEELPKEIHLLYFMFIKELFTNALKKDHISILKYFFSTYSLHLNAHLDFKYSLWLEDYIQECDLNYIAHNLNEQKTYYSSDNYEKVFKRLNVDGDQLELLRKLYKIISYDKDEYYLSKIENLCKLKELRDYPKAEFLKLISELIPNLYARIPSLEGYNKKNYDIINEFNKIGNFLDGDRPELARNFINNTSPENYFIYLNDLISLLKNVRYGNGNDILVNHKLDKEFINKIFIKDHIIWSVGYAIIPQMMHNIIEGINLLLDSIHSGIILNYIQNQLSKDTYFSFVNSFKKFLENIDLFNRCFRSISDSDIYQIFFALKQYFSFEHEIELWINNLLVAELDFQKKISKIKFDSTTFGRILAKGNVISQQLYYNYLISLFNRENIERPDILLTKVEELQNILNNDSEIFSYLFINASKTLPIEYRLKLWIYNILSEFNFNTYCYYYFTLSPEERKIFNKKAKAIMGEELKSSMLKKREPWQFIEKLKKEGSTDIEIYSANWKSIWFGNGNILICIDTIPHFTKPYRWEFAEDKFNLLFDYLTGRRLKELKITVEKEEISNIEGLEELEEVIWKIQIQKEVENGQGVSIWNIGTNRIPVNMILRNQCIQLLNKLQLKGLEPTRVLEKTFNLTKGGVLVDISLLYSIPLNDYEVAVIWESLELEKSKATHIFKCSKNAYESVFVDIEFHLSSKQRVRSSLNSNDFEDVECQKKLHYLCRIDHDNFNYNKWENSLYEILPILKKQNKYT